MREKQQYCLRLYRRLPNSQRKLEEQIYREIAGGCKINSVAIVEDFNVPCTDWDGHSVKGLDGEHICHVCSGKVPQAISGESYKGEGNIDLCLGIMHSK